MRYFIHIRLGQELYEDSIGWEYACLEAACDEAMQAVRVLLNDGDLSDLPDEQWFDIRDEMGELLMTIPFHEAFSTH